LTWLQRGMPSAMLCGLEGETIGLDDACNLYLNSECLASYGTLVCDNGVII
jgi:hypothetical protein